MTDRISLAGLINGGSGAARADSHLKKSTANRSMPERNVCQSSKAQQLSWLFEHVYPQHAALNVSGSWRIDGELENGMVDQAWQLLIQRHEALRAHLEVALGEPIQIVRSHVSFSTSFYDLRALTEVEAGLEVDRIAEIEARAHFVLTAAPLLRVTRIIENDHRSTLLVTAHQAICDRWSLDVLVQEMADICSALQRGDAIVLPEVPTPFGRSAEREGKRRNNGSSEQKSATPKFPSDYKRFELLTDHPRPAVQTSRSSNSSVLLEPSIVSALAQIALEKDSTTPTTLLAAMFSLLHRCSGETDIVVGAQMSNRYEAELQRAVGFFKKTLVSRADLSGDPTFLEIVDRTRGIEPLDLSDFTFERLTDMLDRKHDLSRNPLFSVSFTFDRACIQYASPGNFSVVRLPSHSTALLVDLNFVATELPGGWSLSCEYNADLFDKHTVDVLVSTLKVLLCSVAANPHQRISLIPLLSETDRNHLVVGLNQTQAQYPADRTIAELITGQVTRAPSAIAVVCGDTTLTYAQLEMASNRLARELRRREFGPDKRVGVLLDRSVDLVVALLAVLKAGSAYVPLDPEYPRERLAFIVSNARLSAVISRSTLTERISVSDTPFLNVDADAPAIEANGVEPVESNTAVCGPAYIIYTSGSTGQPKGVPIDHRSLVNVLYSVSASCAFDITENDVHVAVATISFDIATLELFLPLINGACLVVASESEVADSRALHHLLQRTKATFMQGTPITWELLMDAGWIGDPALKILCGGEAISRRLADQLLDRGNILWNGYGPTETAILSSIVRVPRGTGPVLIGPPIANTQLYVVDANGELVPPGLAGELYIGGDGVASGYFERPELTPTRFVPDTFRNIPGAKLYRTGDVVRRRGPDSFEFLGRSDQQIKIRGFRIELGDIEATLLRQPDIKEAVAIIRGVGAVDKAILAYVVPRTDVGETGGAWIANLRSRLSESLPHYMVPAPIIILDALPRTPNSKIDRQALPQIETAKALSLTETPANPTEDLLTALISEMLERESVGRNENIFALGFHSLLAVRLVDRIATSTGVRLPVRAIYDAETVAQLALCIPSGPRSASVSSEREAIVTLNPSGSRRPFLYFHNDLLADGMYCRRLATAVGNAQLIHAIAPHGTAGLPFEYSIEDMARDYLPRIRELQPSGPYRLGGFCGGGLVAYETARLLRAQGETVERLVLINATPLNRSNVTDLILRATTLNPMLPQRFRQVCSNLALLLESLGEGPRALSTFISEKVRSFYKRMKRDPAQALANSESFEQPRSTRDVETFIVHDVARLLYRPQSYQGELTLFWSTDERLNPGAANAKWRRLAKSVHFVEIPGGHYSPMHGSDELARTLDVLLR